MILHTFPDEEVSTRDMFHAPVVLGIVRDIDSGAVVHMEIDRRLVVQS